MASSTSFGGFAGTTYGAPVEPMVSVYDPIADRWSRVADLPLDVTHANAVLVDRTVWLAGGYRGAHPGPAVANVLRYDVAADAWSEGPPLPKPVAAGTLALVGRTLHYVGGFLDRDTTIGEHWTLAVDDGTTWEPRAPLPRARGHLASAVVAGRLYAIGGQIRHDTDPVDLAAVDVYDPERDAWAAVADLPAPRSHFEAATFVDRGADRHRRWSRQHPLLSAQPGRARDRHALRPDPRRLDRAPGATDRSRVDVRARDRRSVDRNQRQHDGQHSRTGAHVRRGRPLTPARRGLWARSVSVMIPAAANSTRYGSSGRRKRVQAVSRA